MTTFKDFERAAWEVKAHRYQDTWGSVTQQSTDAVLDDACLTFGSRLLDCGCGPGHLCERAARRGVIVTGCDYSEKMVQIAASNYPELTFVKEDVEALTFDDCSFDVVILSYLLLHLQDQPKALREAARVLKNRGRLVFTVWLPPQDSPGLAAVFTPLREHADMTVIPPAQDIFMFADVNRARDFLGSLGFVDVSAKRFESRWDVSSADEFFLAVQAGTRIGGMIDLQEPEVKEKIRASIEQSLNRFERDGRYVIPTPSLIVSGTKVV